MSSEHGPETGWSYIARAVVLGVVGFGLLVLTVSPDVEGSASDWLRLVGLVLCSAAGILALIGSVAVGVTLGQRRAEWQARQDQR